MSLILAIEPDQRQAAQLADLIRGRLNADLVHARTTEGALTALAGIGDRVPDLVLVPSLLSAQEDAAIAGALRLIAAAANVQMLTIPRLADPEQPAQHRGVFAKLRGRKPKKGPNGCDPAVFADQIASYLAEAAAERRAQQADDELVALSGIATEAPAATAAPALASETSATDEFSSDPVLDLLAATVLATTEPPIGEPLLAPTAMDSARESVVAPIITPSREPISESIPESVVEPVPVAAAPQPAVTTEVYAPLVLGKPPGLRPVVETQPLIRAATAEPIVKQPSIEIANAPEPIVEPPSREIANAPDLIVPEAFAAAMPESVNVVADREETPVVADVVSDLPAAPRRRRKAVRPPAPKPESTFDLDALLAPLLSELAAKRTMPAKRDKPRPVSAAIDAAPPAAAVPPPEPIVIAPPPTARVLPPSPPAVQEEPALVAPAASRERVQALEPAASIEPQPVMAMAPPAPIAVEEPVPLAVAEPDMDPMFFAEEVPAATSETHAHDRPAWVELIESLRQDIERLKAEQAPPVTAAASVAAREAEPPRLGRILSIAPAPAARHSESTGASESRIRKLTPRARAPRPVQDQWGLFDPDQCGFAALRAKLDEISARDEVSA